MPSFGFDTDRISLEVVRFKWVVGQHAAVRDDSHRLHPSILPYDELSGEEKQKDRNTARAACAAQ